MKHLRQYIRQIILEMAMKQGIDLPPGWAFSCRITDTAYGMPQIHLVDADGYIDYDILKVECFFKEIFYTKNEETGEMEKDETAEKLGYRCFDLRRLDSEPRGYGPLVTEIAMEITTAMGGILFPDRREMSTEAQSMWTRFASRNDVEQFVHPQLGYYGYRKQMNTILKLEAHDQIYLQTDSRRLKLSENIP